MAQLVEGGHLTLEDLREAEELSERLESERGATDEGAAVESQGKSAARETGRTRMGARERGRRR
jgi:hypothetical protein